MAPSPWKELLGIAGFAVLVAPAVAIPLDAAATAGRLRQNTSASPLAEDGGSRTESFSLRP
ncbi:MAG: hypothetical protein VKO64_03950 [Candidatus Sericytochromatia bacterium]|nr:hypothetical protein [Candidatus Sericytochromatia bacterium]